MLEDCIKDAQTVCNKKSGNRAGLRLYLAAHHCLMIPFGMELTGDVLLPVLLFPTIDRVLQAKQSCGIGSLLTFIVDQPFDHRPVAACLAKQVIKQCRFHKRAAEQILRDMWFFAQLPDHGFQPQGKPALGAARWSLGFLNNGIWIQEIDAAVGTLYQTLIDIGAAIAAFGFIVFGWGSDAGGHESIVSNTNFDHAL